MFVDHALMSASHHIQMTMPGSVADVFCTDGSERRERTCDGRANRARATAEAAFLLPVLFVGPCC